MKKLLIIFLLLSYFSVQLHTEISFAINFLNKVVAHYQYKDHLNNLPTRFNLLTELNKFKEHKEQQQKNNLPDFNQQIVFSVHSQVENLSLSVPVSTPLFFATLASLKPFFVFLSNTAPPPQMV